MQCFFKEGPLLHSNESIEGLLKEDPLKQTKQCMFRGSCLKEEPLSGHWKATGQILGKFQVKITTKNLAIVYPLPFDLQSTGDQRGGTRSPDF